MPGVEEQIKDGFTNINKTFEDYKKVNDKAIADLKAAKTSSYSDEKLEKMDKAVDKLESEIERLQKMKNPEISTAEVNDKCSKEGKSAFNQFMRTGSMNSDQEKKYLDSFGERKDLVTNVDPDGGYTVRPEVATSIVKKVFESSPLRQLAMVQSIGTGSFEELVDFDEAGSGWVGELESRTKTGTPQFKMLKTDVHELHASPRASQTLLDDSLIDMESWLEDKVSVKFGREEATAFISGDGIARPKGILSYAAGTLFGQVEQVNSTDANLLVADGLIDLQDTLFEAYQPNAVWLMRRTTRSAARKLKDNQGQYLMAMGDGLQQTTPASLLGKAIRLASDMPVVVANALAIAYGDFKVGYIIVDRIGIRVLRDAFTAKPFVLFYTTKRVGGSVRNSQAIKIGKIAA